MIPCRIIVKKGFRMAFHFLNARQHFASMYWEHIMYESSYQKLKEHVHNNYDKVSEKDRASWESVFEAFDSLPVKSVYTGNGNKINSRVVVGVGTFATKSPTNDEEFPDDYALWGWETLSKIQPLVRLIGQWSDVHQLALDVPTDAIKKVVKWKQRLDNKEYELRVFDPVEILAEAESFAIYIPTTNGTGGYLDGRGYGGAPLAGARMFETAGSAYTTIKSRTLRNAVVVKVKSNLLELDSKNDVSSSNCGAILSAVALMEKKRLEKALEEASVEQLLARLKALEAISSVGNTENEEEPTKRRRM